MKLRRHLARARARRILEPGAASVGGPPALRWVVLLGAAWVWLAHLRPVRFVLAGPSKAIATFGQGPMAMGSLSLFFFNLDFRDEKQYHLID